MRTNPLVGWKVEAAPGSVIPAYRVLTRDDSEDRYAQVLTKVDLPLYVFLPAPYKWVDSKAEAQARKRAKELSLQHKAVVLLVEPLRPESAFLAMDQSVGSPFRASPFTPFILLHRIYDSVSLERSLPEPKSDAAGYPLAELKMYVDDYMRLFASAERSRRLSRDANPVASAKWASRGVDTAAGRLGALWRVEVLSDLYAKWCLTGKLAYTMPEATTEQEATLFSFIAEGAEESFVNLNKYLRVAAATEGCVVVI